MADSILQTFLDNRFIKTDNPDHIDNLNKVVAEIQKQLNKEKINIIGYTLVALDPTIPDDDPIVVKVEALIIKQWTTFKNSVVKTKDTPIAYIQAVILEALDKLSSDENIAAIVWYTGFTIISYYKLAGQEKILKQFLLEIGKKVEESGRKKWDIIENAKIDNIDPFELNHQNIDRTQISVEEVKNHLLAAAVHSPWAGQAGGGENPQHTATANHEWPKFFAERAAKGLSDVINKALDISDKSISSINESLETYFSKKLPYFEQVSASILQSSQSLNKRINLLWWKQALYSLKLDLGYRSLSPLAMSIAMAVDLAESVPPIHPQSIDYFLKETLRDILAIKTDEEVLISELLEQLQKFSSGEKCLFDFLCHGIEGRKSLGSCMADLMRNTMNVDEFFIRTGLEKSSKISLGNLSIWLFHDMHAIKLANEKKSK